MKERPLILLPFIDYTEQFKEAMRNWRVDPKNRPIYIDDEQEYLEMIKIAETIVKNSLRTLDKVWAIAIEKDMETDLYFNNSGDCSWYESESYNKKVMAIGFTLYLRAGPKDIRVPFDKLTNMLNFGQDYDFNSNKGMMYHKTRLYFNFPLNHPIARAKNWLGMCLREIEAKPLKLKEWFDKIYNKEFW